MLTDGKSTSGGLGHVMAAEMNYVDLIFPAQGDAIPRNASGSCTLHFLHFSFLAQRPSVENFRKILPIRTLSVQCRRGMND